MDPEETYGRSSVFKPWDPVRQCFFLNTWRIRQSKAEELILPPRGEQLRTPPSSEEFESTAEKSETSSEEFERTKEQLAFHCENDLP